MGRGDQGAVRQADVVIPLLSADSVQNEMLRWEIHQAYDEARQRGLPRLLPVRVNYAKPLPQELGAILDRLQYHFLWIGPQDDERLVADLVPVLHGTRPMVPPPPIAFPVGGLPLDAQSYVQRRSDPIFHAAIARRDSIVLVRGARQMGKTSLLARGLQRAEEDGARVAFTDFQRLNQSELESLEAFYKALGAGLAEALELDVRPEEVWKPALPPNTNFHAYVRDRVLAASDAPLVWALDEVDRLFTCPFRTEVFALFRSWHNARTMPPAKFADLWKRLTLCIAFATEAHLFINNLDQSPFNVGTTITLEDFTLEQVADLNVRYHSPLRDDAELRAFYDLVGGHPYLVNRGLFEMAEHGLDPAAFRAQAEREEGLFGDHLRRMLMLLAQDPELLKEAPGDPRRRAVPLLPELLPPPRRRRDGRRVPAGRPPPLPALCDLFEEATRDQVTDRRTTMSISPGEFFHTEGGTLDAEVSLLRRPEGGRRAVRRLEPGSILLRPDVSADGQVVAGDPDRRAAPLRSRAPSGRDPCP